MISDDITFCLNDCLNFDCFRHPCNIKDKSIPHSYAYLKETQYCELVKYPPLSYECFHCGEKAVSWENDFSFEDCGYIGEGLVHILYCNSCGAIIEYRISDEDPSHPFANDVMMVEE